MRLSHTLLKQRRTPCFPQIDIPFRAILYEKRPPFIILFSHQTTSYSQILFTHPLYVPSEEIFFDFPSGCHNPCCNDDCEMIRFPRRGVEGASVLSIKRGGRNGRKELSTLHLSSALHRAQRSKVHTIRNSESLQVSYAPGL
jgi:hypothetical protein